MLIVLFSSVGAGYFIYGKKQVKFVSMISGILLCVLPYIISHSYLMGGIGIVLMALPFLISE